MDVSENDLALIASMRRYFEAKHEADVLKRRLEAARNDAGEEIGRFYDPRLNSLHAEDILAWHRLRKEMEELMGLAARWGRGGNIEESKGSPATETAAAGTVHLLGIHAVTD